MSRVLVACALAATVSLTGCGLRHHVGPMPGAPEEATYAVIDGVRLRYVDVGEGPAVILVHGFASSLDVWDAVVPALARDHRVLALDLMGFGWSDRPEADYGPQAQAELVRAFLDARGVARAHVVAHSWGASVALALALEHPERVDRLALFGAWVYEAQLPMFFLWSRAPGVGEALFGLWYRERAEDRLALAFHDPTRLPQALVDDVEAALRRPGTTAAALAAARGQRFTGLEAQYGAIDHPVLLVWGREDAVSRLAHGERLARQLPRSRMVVIPRCGHLPMVEAPAASNAALVAFLGEAAP